MPRIKHSRHLNGIPVSQAEFQTGILEAIHQGYTRPSDITKAIGWDGNKEERSVVTSELNQLARLGLIEPPNGYSVSPKGMARIEMYSPDLEAKRAAYIYPPDRVAPVPPPRSAAAAPDSTKWSTEQDVIDHVNSQNAVRPSGSSTNRLEPAPARSASPSPIRPTMPRIAPTAKPASPMHKPLRPAPPEPMRPTVWPPKVQPVSPVKQPVRREILPMHLRPMSERRF
jgi:hypothetical protein